MSYFMMSRIIKKRVLSTDSSSNTSYNVISEVMTMTKALVAYFSASGVTAKVAIVKEGKKFAPSTSEVSLKEWAEQYI